MAAEPLDRHHREPHDSRFSIWDGVADVILVFVNIYNVITVNINLVKRLLIINNINGLTRYTCARNSPPVWCCWFFGYRMAMVMVHNKTYKH